MREIKFRYWNTLTEQMVLNPKMPYKKDWTIEQLFSDRGWIWEQYTGLKDKNGKEIFEGDIIKLNGLWDIENIGIIMFGEYDQDGSGNEYSPTECIGFYLKCIDLEKDEDGEPHAPYYETTSFIPFLDDFEVIGNIHENSELLEVEK